jgi:hypothetical protein
MFNRYKHLANVYNADYDEIILSYVNTCVVCHAEKPKEPFFFQRTDET